jgi:hypothetical protein
MPDLNRIQASEPVLITDGVDAVSIISTVPIGNEGGLITREASRGHQVAANCIPVVLPVTNTYAIAATNTNVSIATSTVASFAYLWHPASVTKTYNLRKITIATNNGGGITQAIIKITRIIAENATPGGTTLAPVALNASSPSSGATFRFGATGNPTRITTDIFHRPFVGNMFSTNMFDIPIDMTPLVCRAGIAEGWEVRFDVSTPILSNLRASVEFLWIEE